MKDIELDLVFPCIVNFLSLAVLGDFSNASVCCFKSFKSECETMEGVKQLILAYCLDVLQSSTETLIFEDCHLFDHHRFGAWRAKALNSSICSICHPVIQCFLSLVILAST
jgi:hypothetical protein